MENGIEGLQGKKKGRKPRVLKPKPPKTREEELLKRIEDLEIENEYLKKRTPWLQSGKSAKAGTDSCYL